MRDRHINTDRVILVACTLVTIPPVESSPTGSEATSWPTHTKRRQHAQGGMDEAMRPREPRFLWSGLGMVSRETSIVVSMRSMKAW